VCVSKYFSRWIRKNFSSIFS